MIEVISNSPDETAALGRQIAGHLSAGSVVALQGTLGSGKTYLTKGIAIGLGINETLTSPTYTIINEYKRDNSPSLFHIDAYRLNDDKEFEEVGGIQIVNSGEISIIEWSERIPKSIPDDSITVHILITGQSSRLIKINGIDKL